MTYFSANHELLIEDPGNHPVEIVDRFRQLLDTGAERYEDPRREAFYELHDDSVVYYFHVSPSSGRIYLLGTWPKLAASIPV